MATTLAAGTVVAGRYRVHSLIGEGGMGSVYLVEHVHTDEQLAMKVLHAQTLRDETAVERFRREARAPARIQSEHVARVTDADTAPELDGAPFYVMEYLRGKDLDTVLRENGPLAPLTVVEYLRQTARALDKAHGMGIVHRDLKPENLFLTSREDGTPCIKLLDFGIAKLVGVAHPTELKTQSGAVFGTPAFMSPEQTRGENETIGPESDIWAFGLIAFKLLTGRDYWTANVLAQLYVEILQAPIVPPSARGANFGPIFDAWFLRCVAREIPMRFTTTGEAVSALADALGVEMSRASIASLAWMSHDPSAVDATHKTQGWPPAHLPPIVGLPPEARAQQAVHPSPELAPPLPFQPVSKGFPVGIVLGVLGFGAVLVCILGFGIYRALQSESFDKAAASGTTEVVPGAPPTPPSPIATASATASSEVVASAPSVEPAATGVINPNDDARIHHGSPGSRAKASTLDDSPKADKSEKAEKAEPTRGPTDDQRRRLESLQRLCDSGTVPPAECASKRAAILRSN
jgi:serine/threonine protein kinase